MVLLAICSMILSQHSAALLYDKSPNAKTISGSISMIFFIVPILSEVHSISPAALQLKSVAVIAAYAAGRMEK